jgi:hypothetical protein
MLHQFKPILRVVSVFAAVYLNMSPRQTAVGSRRFDATFYRIQGSKCHLYITTLQGEDTTLAGSGYSLSRHHVSEEWDMNLMFC